MEQNRETNTNRVNWPLTKEQRLFIPWRKDSNFNNGAEITRHSHTKIKNKRNVHKNLKLFTNMNSKNVINLKVKCKTIKLQEDNTGEILDDLGLAIAFQIQNQWSTKEITDKLDFNKIKIFFYEKKIVKRMKRQAIELE